MGNVLLELGWGILSGIHSWIHSQRFMRREVLVDVGLHSISDRRRLRFQYLAKDLVVEGDAVLTRILAFSDQTTPLERPPRIQELLDVDRVVVFVQAVERMGGLESSNLDIVLA